MADFDNVKDFIMNVVNGNAPVSSLATRNVQESAKRLGAEAKHAFQTAKVVTPQLTKIGLEITKLEAMKVAKQAELTAVNDALQVVQSSIEIAEATLGNAKRAKAELQNRVAKARARAKTKGTAISTDNTLNSDISQQRDALDKLKTKGRKLSDKVANIQKDIDSYTEKINVLKNQISVLNAQVSPQAALAEAQVRRQKAQKKVDEAPTPEAREVAEAELEEATEMETTVQAIADDTENDIQQIQEEQEPEMMMIQADFELIKSGVNTLNYLTTNIPVFIGAASTSIGANGGGPVPMLPTASLPLGNVMFGFAFTELAAVKSASIRMLANCQKIGYVPTTEMTYINMIPTAEASLMGLAGGIAPAGLALTQA